jgi:hypothetical protein
MYIVRCKNSKTKQVIDYYPNQDVVTLRKEETVNERGQMSPSGVLAIVYFLT